MNIEQVGMSTITHEIVIRVKGHPTEFVIATIESLITISATDGAAPVATVHWGDLANHLRSLAHQFEEND
jgi:hypothetical protein